MTAKRLRLRPLARSDIRTITLHYRLEAGKPTASALATALERAFAHLSAQPGSGSLRYAEAAGVPGLRAWPLRRFPYLVLYVEQEDHLVITRILPARRDIPARLREQGEDERA